MEDPIKYIDSSIKSLHDKLSTSDAVIEIEVQEELAHILSISRRLKSAFFTAKLQDNKNKLEQIEAIIPNLDLAICALQGNPNKVLAQNVRRDAEYFLRQIENPFTAFFVNNFFKFLYSTETHTKVVLGLFLALPIHLLAPIVLAYILSTANFYLKPLFKEQSIQPVTSQNIVEEKNPEVKNQIKLTEYEFYEASVLLVLSAMSGATGSVVSIMLRLDQYRNPRYKETLLPIFVGAFKPAIGAFLGIFVFALISSTLLPITISKDEEKPINRWLAFLAITFVVGFSERLANDVVSQAERIVPGRGGSQEKSETSASQLSAPKEEDKQKDRD
ncbi:hypothetical protein [Calothrix sp. NIES-2098]|uniref:hypothetical protein n=1 Tax=Calothrix sp. NIES-2098 TaxID=1954171 RepID=UPI000B5E199D|nr:hypothetical protein NIES2098_37140 [Calothrix sp. NIES-2098]